MALCARATDTCEGMVKVNFCMSTQSYDSRLSRICLGLGLCREG